MELKRGAQNFTVVRIGGPGSRTLRFTGSDESVDRYGTIIKQDGWKLDHYRRNPVFLWAHDSTLLPIGKAVRVEVEKTERKASGSEKRMVFDIEFATHPFAREVENLYENGFLSATSVGWKPIKTRAPYEDEAKQYGDSLREVFEENELYELSAVPVPGNPYALIEHLAGLAPEIRSIAPDKLDEKNLGRILEDVRKALDIKTAATPPPAPAPAAPPEENLDAPVSVREFRALVASLKGYETRVADCFRGLAKRTELTALELQLDDQAREIKALKNRGAGPNGSKAPHDLMDLQLSAGAKSALEETHKLLTQSNGGEAR